MSDIRIIADLNQARKTILLRGQPGSRPVPESVMARTEAAMGERLTPEQVVERIIEMVREGGDNALRDLTARLDGVHLQSFQISPQLIEAAYSEVNSELVAALHLAADRIRRFHERAMPRTWIDFEKDGAVGQLFVPIERVGIYVPGGQANYPSTVLMQAVPARVAGVREVIVACPLGRDGRIAPVTLVAADIAGVDRVLSIGGAQAIAALAFGTESVPRVDKILGPGNLFVALAKQKVYGRVGIDQIAGPTETLLIADETVSARSVAADLIAQAEHDASASAIALTTSIEQARRIQSEVDRQVAQSPRASIVRESLQLNGGIVVVENVGEALDVANDYAPEHLCLLVANPWALLPLVRNAGGVFVGETSLEAVGDYTAGPSHVMPTGGSARFSSPLSVHDFMKIISLFALGPKQIRELGPPAMTIANAEGLVGHSAAVRARLEERGS
ncbi:MAG TPA: histidinol dehydrogenase [Chloroflexota bacterium]|nr:histidinol dehydrogenase [Chloroflexota bacterium]